MIAELFGLWLCSQAMAFFAIYNAQMKGAKIKKRMPVTGSKFDKLIQATNQKAAQVLSVPDQMQALANQAAAQSTFYTNESYAFTTDDFYLRIFIGIGSSANFATVLGLFGAVNDQNIYAIVLSFLVVCASVISSVGQFYALSTSDWNIAVQFSALQSDILLELATDTDTTSLTAFYETALQRYQQLMTDQSGAATNAPSA